MLLTNGKHLNFKVYRNGYAIVLLQSNNHKRLLIMDLIKTIWLKKRKRCTTTPIAHRKLSVWKIVKTDINNVTKEEKTTLRVNFLKTDVN